MDWSAVMFLSDSHSDGTHSLPLLRHSCKNTFLQTRWMHNPKNEMSAKPLKMPDKDKSRNTDTQTTTGEDKKTYYTEPHKRTREEKCSKNEQF